MADFMDDPMAIALSERKTYFNVLAGINEALATLTSLVFWIV